jgi:hypothetical protein
MLGNSKNLPRGGKNRRKVRYCPPRFDGLRASDPKMSLLDQVKFGHRVQPPSQLFDMIQNDELMYDRLDPEDWVVIEQSKLMQYYFDKYIEFKDENVALKDEIEALKAEIEQLKQQQQNPSPSHVTSGIFQQTPYRDAVTISPATILKRKMANFSRRVRLFFILLDAFNQIIKHRCKLNDDEAEIEGCGSVLRKIFELVTIINADISENTLTIPDLDFKFYGSKENFEAFAKNVSEWISEKGLNIPGTHFIISEMRRFTAKKIMSNGSIAEYEKFMLEVIDSSTKEIFMIDIMNVDGSTVFPCDFTVNSLAVSPKRGIYAKDPLHRKGKFNFIGVIGDISSGRTTCMTRSSWKFEEFSLNFLTRILKMREASYKVQGAPALTTALCTIMCEDATCVSLTGCRCKDSKEKPMPVSMSIYAAINIYEQKRCPNCRDILKDFVCSAVESIESMCEPKELPSKAEFELLTERAERMGQGYSFSGLKELSEESKDAFKTLYEFSRKTEVRENDAQMRAGSAPVPAHIIAEEEAEEEIVFHFVRELARNRADRFWDEPVPAHPMRPGPVPARQFWDEPAPARPMRAGGAAAPVRRPQYDYDSGEEEEYLIIRRYGS